MSVLVKGMEMPKDCVFCPMFQGAWTMCSVLHKTTSIRGRPTDCPLVEIPTPHGRLVDANALEGKLPVADPDVKVSHNAMIRDFVFLLEDASTIIGAEPPKDGDA